MTIKDCEAFFKVSYFSLRGTTVSLSTCSTTITLDETSVVSPLKSKKVRSASLQLGQNEKSPPTTLSLSSSTSQTGNLLE